MLFRSKITEEYNEQNQTLILISNAISDVRALSDIEKDIKRDKEEEKGIFVAVKSLEVEASQLESAKNSLKRDYDALQESLQKVSLAGNQAVEELRHSLKSGDDCPVCGSRIDKILSDDAFKSIFAPIKEACQAKKAELDEAESKYNDLISTLKSKCDLLSRIENIRKNNESKREEKMELAKIGRAHV